MIVDRVFGGNYARSGSYRRFWAARILLFERVFGIVMREKEHEERTAEDKLAADYARSVRLLQQQQGE